MSPAPSRTRSRLKNGAFETDSEATQTFTANNAGSNLAVSINGGADGIDASNTAYGYYSQAIQTIALSGVDVIGAEGQGLDLDNETYYTAGFSVATQTVTVGQGSAASPVSISGYEEGIAGNNYANGYYSQATQSITLTGVSVTSEIEDAVGIDNKADGEDSTANSTFIATNTGATELNINGYWDGVDAQNGTYGYYAQATQTITLSGMSVEGTYGQGLDLDNDAISDFSVATQTVTVDNGNVQDALGNPLRVSISGETGIQAVNDADDYYAQAVQSVVLSGASITGTANDGVEMRNVADSTGAVADQKVNVGDAVIDGYEGGVVMVNDGDASRHHQRLAEVQPGGRHHQLGHRLLRGQRDNEG